MTILGRPRRALGSPSLPASVLPAWMSTYLIAERETQTSELLPLLGTTGKPICVSDRAAESPSIRSPSAKWIVTFIFSLGFADKAVRVDRARMPLSTEAPSTPRISGNRAHAVRTPVPPDGVPHPPGHAPGRHGTFDGRWGQ